MNQEISGDEVLAAKSGSLGIITLNRPKALNALTIDMIRMISGTLRQWEKDPHVQAVLFMGNGTRGFCAGGDIKNFHRMGMEYRRGSISHRAASMFFAEEYSLNRQIFHYSKPTIAFMDGIVMGGGFGLGGNCKHRIVTENTVFAMPETGIGFFPDVGAAFHLLRAPYHLGRYLALTGAMVNGADMMMAECADYYMPNVKREALIDALEGGGEMQDMIEQFATSDAPDGKFKKNAEKIGILFREKDVTKTLKILAEDASPFALETVQTIESRSPTSVMVTAEHLRRSEGASFNAVIAEDYILAQRFLERGDFYEGIRAAVIDKDKNPQWNPKLFSQVGGQEIDAYFEPTGHNLEDVKLLVSQ